MPDNHLIGVLAGASEQQWSLTTSRRGRDWLITITRPDGMSWEVTEHLRAVSGFRGARLLRQDEGQEIIFTSITFFTGLDAVRGFAGDDYEQAVVEDTARQVLSHWDEQVSHHEVVAELE